MSNLIQHLIYVHISYSTACENTIFPSYLQPSNSTQRESPFFGPIPWKLTRPPFSDCSCCSIICKRDWRDETTRRPAARWTVKTLEAKEWKPQGFQLRNYKVKVTWWRTTQSFFYNIFLLKPKKYITSNVESTWKHFLNMLIWPLDILEWL